MKRWPWVSRELYEQMDRTLREIIAAQAKLLREERDDNQALLDKYHALKLSGAHEPTPVVPPPPHALAKYPKTRAALDAMGHGQQGSVRRAMTAEAVKMLTVEGLSDEHVALAVARGEPYQPREDIT